MAWGYRASSYANDGTGFTGLVNLSTTTVTFGGAVTAGDLLVMAIVGGNSIGGDPAPTFSVSDSVNGSAWTEVASVNQVSPVPVRNAVWACPNSGAGTPVVTVTINSSAGQIFGGKHVAAFSGIVTTSPVDTIAAAVGTSAAASSGAVGATGAANELQVGCYLDLGYNTTLAVGTINGVTATLAGKHESDPSKTQGLFEYADSGSSGATGTATATPSGSTSWGMLSVVFKIIAVPDPFPLLLPPSPIVRTVRYP